MTLCQMDHFEETLMKLESKYKFFLQVNYTPKLSQTIGHFFTASLYYYW